MAACSATTRPHTCSPRRRRAGASCRSSGTSAARSSAATMASSTPATATTRGVKSMFGARARVLSAAAFAVVVATGISTLHSQTTPPAAEWSYYGGDLKFQRYSSLDQINKSNVGRLQIAWRRPGVNPEMLKQFPTMRVNAYLRATPTLVNGILYVPNAIGLITAVNPETGETI